MNLEGLHFQKLIHMSNDELRQVARDVLQTDATLRQEMALLYYEPASENVRKIHRSAAPVFGAFGGNGSSKTESCLVDLLACATGIVPPSIAKDFPREKLRGPIHCRIVVESLTTTLHTIILPKLQYWKWTGIDVPGGKRGHWGWIPRSSLIAASWEKSWSEKFRTLRLLYRDPDDPDRVAGESMIQFLSKDNDPTDFASGDFHIILHDEPPTLPIWRENEARTMRVGGRMVVAMTWPDDPSINVEWIHDELYEPGLDPANERVETVNLYTTDNRTLDQEAIAVQAASWDEETRRVRIYGGHVRFSNRVHPLFTKDDLWWCFRCGKPGIAEDGRCNKCQSGLVALYNHVTNASPEPYWPVVYLLDPHPRKPHMMLWVAVDPNDDYHAVAEAEVEGDPTDVRMAVDQIEHDRGLAVVKRMIDPNMGRSPASTQRGITWQDAFEAAGIRCDLSDDSAVGRKRIDEWLRPDPQTRRPRLDIHSGCAKTITQMLRYVWDDWRKGVDRDAKQKPKEKHDDFPTLLKYYANEEPTFAFLQAGPLVLRRFPGAERRH